MLQFQDISFVLQQELCSLKGFGQAFRAGSSGPRTVPFAYLFFVIT